MSEQLYLLTTKAGDVQADRPRSYTDWALAGEVFQAGGDIIFRDHNGNEFHLKAYSDD